MFALLSLGTTFFLFMTLSQSLESGGWGSREINPAPSGWRLTITAEPSFKWWVLASLRRMKGPAAALGC